MSSSKRAGNVLFSLFSFDSSLLINLYVRPSPYVQLMYRIFKLDSSVCSPTVCPSLVLILIYKNVCPSVRLCLQNILICLTPLCVICPSFVWILIYKNVRPSVYASKTYCTELSVCYLAALLYY